MGGFAVACTHLCSLLTSPHLFPTCSHSLTTCLHLLPTYPHLLPIYPCLLPTYPCLSPTYPCLLLPAPTRCTPTLIMAWVCACTCHYSHTSICAHHCMWLSVLTIRVGGEGGGGCGSGGGHHHWSRQQHLLLLVLSALVHEHKPSFICAHPCSCTGCPSFMLHPPLFWPSGLYHLYSHN